MTELIILDGLFGTCHFSLSQLPILNLPCRPFCTDDLFDHHASSLASSFKQMEPLLEMHVLHFHLVQARSSPQNLREPVGLEEFLLPGLALLSEEEAWLDNIPIKLMPVLKLGFWCWQSWCLREEGIESHTLALLVRTSRHTAN